MNQTAEKIYKQKLTTAQEAVKLVKSGDTVFVGTSTSFAYALMDALYDRKDELENVTLACSSAYIPNRAFNTQWYEGYPFTISSYFIGAQERNASAKFGIPVDYTSFHLSQVDLWAKKIAKPDVCFFEVSKPDELGNCSNGPAGGVMFDDLASVARNIILEVNSNTPYIIGEKCFTNIADVDAIVEADLPIFESVPEEPDEISNKISEIVLAEVPDGATFQLGLGKLSTAIGYGLKEKNDLGVYSELFSDPMMELMLNGNVTNRQKGYMDGVSVYAFSLGTKKLYDFLGNNPQLYCGSFPFVNDPRRIQLNKKMISINTAMSIDLFGQVAADSMAWKQQSACGGQVDFVRGAQWSEGGKSIIAMNSSFMKNGKLQSKICLNFAAGTAVTTARSDVQYVATEYGIVNLKELTASDRARALISIAHPDFRDQLTDQAKEVGLIR